MPRRLTLQGLAASGNFDNVMSVLLRCCGVLLQGAKTLWLRNRPWL